MRTGSKAVVALPVLEVLPTLAVRSGLRSAAMRLRGGLLGAVGITALMMGTALATPLDPPEEPAVYEGLCALDGATVTCTLDQAAGGVYVGDVEVTDLDILNLTSDIIPADGVGGVVFDTTSSASVDIDLGEYSIQATGVGGNGVYISSYGNGTTAGLILVGDVDSTGGAGISVEAPGVVTVDVTGNVSSLGQALKAKSWGAAVTVDHVGDLTSLEQGGLYVEGSGVDVDLEGDTDSLGDGIHTHSWGAGSTTLVVDGNVNARAGRGVVVEEDFSSANVTIVGNIVAREDALDVSSITDATVSVTGTITSHKGRGVVVVAAEGNALLDLSSTTTAKGDAISVTAGGADNFGIDIDSNGAVTSYEGRGIFAEAKTSGGMTADSQTFGVRIDQTGTVTAKLDAITATTVSSNVYVDVAGDVVSYIGKGITASSLDKLVDVDVTGKIESKLDAVTIAARTSSTLDAGNVTSFAGTAISATVIEGGMTIVVADVTGKVDGIYVNAGNGSASVTADTVVAYDGKGVHVEAAKSSATITVEDVTSKLDAIYAYSGNGSVSVTADNVTSYSGKGITAQTANGGVTLTLDNLTSQLDAIYAEAASNSVSITAADIISYDGKGVTALAAKSSVTLNLDDVTSQGDAIYAGAGNGAVNVTAEDVYSEDGIGIFAQSLTSTATVTAGDVESQGDAIYAEASNGAATVTAGNVTSEEGRGVVASAIRGSASVDVGDVDSHLDAIYAEGGTGSVTVDAGNVTSAAGKGVFGTTGNGFVDIAVGSVTSDLDAIYAQSTGASNVGSVTIAATGNVLSHNGKGVYAYAVNGLIDIDTLGVTSKLDAVTASALNGAIDIAATGAIWSYEGKGIDAATQTGTVDISAASVTGKLAAITASTQEGAIGVTITGAVVSDAGKGIDVATQTGAIDISAASVTGKLDAITASTPEGAIGITVTGAVQSWDGKGIDVATESGAIDIATGAISSKLDAVTVWAADGAIDIDVTGAIVSHDGKGVVASAANGAIALAATGDVTAKQGAIKLAAENGTVTLDIGGAITSHDGKGIDATSQNGLVDIDTGSVTAKLDAITASTPDGNVEIDVAGSVLSHSGAGISAIATNGNVLVDVTGSVGSELDAIYAEASNGTIDITTGNVSSAKGKGVFAQSLAGAVTLTLGAVESDLDAVYAQTNVGGVSVTTGDVSSLAGRGVFAQTSAGNTILDLGDVTTELAAVYAEASDNVYVDADDIVSRAGAGVYAATANGLIEVTVGSVDSKGDAIFAESSGASDQGWVLVTAEGAVTSGDGRGVYAYADNGRVGIDTGAVTAKGDAVTADSRNGSVTVDVGAVTSYDGVGINAYSDSDEISLTAGAVTSKLDAILADGQNGQVSITAGAITSYDGSAIITDTATGNITIHTGSITSKLGAVDAATLDGTTEVHITGNLDSYDGFGIDASTKNGAVRVSATGSVTSKLDAIITSSKGASAADLVDIDIGGAVTSYSGKAIQAASDNGSITVAVDGAIDSKLDAITATTRGGETGAKIDITTGGAIVSHSGAGILAEAAIGSITIDNTGTLEARLGGIEASTTGAGTAAFIDITQTGKLTAWTGIGIDAYSAGGPVTILASGGIEADLDAILAVSDGDDNIGTVTVTSTGTITSHKGSGIVATTVREGITIDSTGAIFADVDGISATGTGNTDTSGIDIDQEGDITVAKGRGIHAEGLVGVDIALDGDITGGTHGIHATSLAGAVEVAIAEGSVISGSSAAGVYLVSETGATLTNRGDISSAWGYAVEFAGVGAGTVDNYGTISGDLAYGYVAGSFNNLAGSTFNAGTALDLAGGTLTNAGLIDFSTDEDSSPLVDSALTGNLVQTETGRLNSDIRFSDNASDRLVISGTATIGGTVSVRAHDIDAGLLKDFMLVTASEGLTLDGVTLSNPVLKGTVVAENGTDAILRIEGVDFAPAPLTEQFVPTSTYVGDVFTAGPPEELKPLMAELLSTPDIESYEEALDQLDAEQYGQEILNAYNYNLSFSNRLLSCRVADGDNRFKAEGECDWFGVRGSVLEQDATDEISAFEQTFATLEAGTQRSIDENWRIGGAVGITNSMTSSADGSTMQGTQGQVGAVVKYDADAFLLASTLSAGYGVTRSERNVSIGNVDDTLVGDAPTAYLSTRLHGAYTFDMGAAYIKPLFNLDLTATHFAGVTETGGATALTIESGTQYGVTFNPAIEIGGEIADGGGTLIRPFAQVGVEASLTSDLELDARFSNVDPSVGAFVIAQPDPEPVAKLSLGADMLTTDNATLRVFYDGSFGASSRKNGVGMKFSGTFD